MNTYRNYKKTKKTITCSVTDETYSAIATVAKKRGMHLHELIRQLIYRELSGLKRID